ncbi:hypothetical protein [Amycolatopsis thailandensis]|uniref:hypothetical protein n=1 Tax=Amycolatopsis thailandensis TaxID=589330 RepID=UPI0036334D94
MRGISRVLAGITLGLGLSAGVLAPAALALPQADGQAQAATSCDSTKESARVLLKLVGRPATSNETKFLVDELQWIQDNSSNVSAKKLAVGYQNILEIQC